MNELIKSFHASEEIIEGNLIAMNHDGTVRKAENSPDNSFPIGVAINSHNDSLMEIETVTVSMGGWANVECDDGKIYTVDIGSISVDDLDEQGRVRANSEAVRVEVKAKMIKPVKHIEADVVLKIVKKQESNREIIEKRLDAI